MNGTHDTPPLSRAEAKALLRIARAALEAHLGGMPEAVAGGSSPGLALRAGVFVTLRAGGDLRGCIGWLASDEPLRESVGRCAVAAASADPRFAPIAADELAGLTIEVSVLSPMRPVRDPLEVVAGRDGVMIECGARRGLLLPQVATEAGWDREALLEGVCSKAGLPPRGWEAGGSLYRFTAQVFVEEAEPAD